VSRPPEEIRATVLAVAEGCAALRGTAPPRAELLEIVDARGPGFGSASAAETEAALFALHTEGYLLDPTYGAEAFALAIERARRATGPIVWWHTGGVLPAGAWLTRLAPEPTAVPTTAVPTTAGRRP
jgi:1-aminocyclopropane-1-carboxylate deaminase/D-cysteine desulfhydrase-like pyridoxal-dependent ACC family enzyme